MSNLLPSRSVVLGISAIVLAIALAGSVSAQTATYRLHKEASSTTGLNQLKTANPDAATTALNSANLKNLATGEYIIKAFDTQSGIPNVSGVIPASSTVTFTLWLKKSANVGTMFPRAKLNLNSAAGTSLCNATGSTALTTTLTKYTLTCTTAASISMSASDRFYVWIGVNLTAGGSSNFQASLNVEGTLNGNYDSYVAVPLPISSPSISGLSATSGTVGTSITVNGSNFGSTQGASTLKFNGVAATPASWSATSIVAPVPSAATTGQVVVTVNGTTSNGIAFTVKPKVNSLSPTSGPVATSVTISGTTFGATQGSSTVTFNGVTATPSSWSDTNIVTQVPPGTHTGPVVVTVGGQASSVITFTVTPKIDNLSPTTGAFGTSVTISGTSFGASQGSSTVTFNGTTATPSSWSDTSIVAPVPASVTTGPVIVNVGGSSSNGVTFTVVTSGAISGKITAAGGATPIPGATVKALQGSNVVSTTTTNSTGDYSFAAVDAGTYAITASASGYGSKSKSLVIVSGGATTTANLSLDAIVSGAVSYIYDAVGRLVSTVSPADTVVYGYDAVGNLLSISRQSSSQVSIIQLGPASGPVGATVTISGTAFSANASQNTVAFNGVAATVNSATSTQIVATVPAGTTTGPVSVTSPNGSATSAVPFTVTGSQGAPAISGFTPTIGYVGTPVTISGDNFETAATNNKLKFNASSAGASSATATSLTTSVPAASGSGRISVTTPAGSATSTADFYVLPTGSTAADFQLMGRMTFPGSQTVTITTAGKKALLLFDGVAGQRMSLDPTNNNIGISTLAIYKPDGTLWTSKQMYTWSQNFFETQSIPVSGTYTMLLDTLTNYSGSMTLNLYNVPPDVAGPIAFGSATPVAITTPGQNARLTFNGSAGQKVSLHASGMSITSSSLSILKPDGSVLTSLNLNINGDFLDNTTLPVNGTYTILLDPSQGNAGNATLTLYDSSDLVIPITPGGTPVTVSGTVPGQNAKLTFSGTAGQRVFLKMTGISFNQYGGNVSVRNSAGTSLAAFQIFSSTTSGTIDALTLPASDTYYILVDQGYMGVGSIGLTLFDVPADQTGAITIGGPAVNLTTTTPGQNGSLSFTGNAGQKISLIFSRTMTNMNVNTNVTIKKPDGTTLVGPTPMGPNTDLIDQQTLPVSGTYNIVVDPTVDNTGTMTFTLFDATDMTGTITPGGLPVTVTTTVPGQNARITFSGNAGQKVSLNITNVALSASVSILNPDGSTLTFLSFVHSHGSFIDTKILPTSGTYTILVNGGHTSTGSLKLTLYDAADFTGSLVVGGPAVNMTTTSPGQDAVLTFEGTAGQQVTVRVTNNNLSNALVRLNAPDGSMLTQNWTVTTTLNLATQTLPVTGTYSIIINPSGASIGQMNINVTNP